MLSNFRYLRPHSLAHAIEHAAVPGAVLHGGGTDLLGLLRDGVTQADTVVSLSGLAELRGLGEERGRLRIGALTTVAELAANPVVQRTVRPLLRARRRGRGAIVVPVWAGRPSHPVLFGREVFSELATSPLELGARQRRGDRGGAVRTVRPPARPRGAVHRGRAGAQALHRRLLDPHLFKNAPWRRRGAPTGSWPTVAGAGRCTVSPGAPRICWRCAAIRERGGRDRTSTRC